MNHHVHCHSTCILEIMFPVCLLLLTVSPNHCSSFSAFFFFLLVDLHTNKFTYHELIFFQVQYSELNSLSPIGGPPLRSGLSCVPRLGVLLDEWLYCLSDLQPKCTQVEWHSSISESSNAGWKVICSASDWKQAYMFSQSKLKVYLYRWYMLLFIVFFCQHLHVGDGNLD